MRIRTIKPEFWTDSFMVQLPPIARLIYISLWTAADDHGFISDESDRLAMQVMPREDPLLFDDWLQFFVVSERLTMLSDGNGHTYYQIRKWADHQKIDRPSKSKISREGSRGLAIPLEVRREVAKKYGCSEGGEVEASCYYCDDVGKIHWHRLRSGKPSAWVTFPGLELDHLEARSNGGSNSSGNIVLACRKCNRSKGTKHWIDRLCNVNHEDIPTILARAREGSTLDQGSGIMDQGSGIAGRKSVCSEVLSVPGGAEKAHLIYAAYPRKVGRPAALKAIIRALDKVPYDELLKSVEAYAAEQAGKDPQYIPHPTTWFNQERWADGPMAKPDEREIGFPVVKASREKALWAEGEPDVIDLDSEYRKCVGEDSDETGVDVDPDVGSSGGDVSGDASEDVCDEEPADSVPS